MADWREQHIYKFCFQLTKTASGLHPLLRIACGDNVSSPVDGKPCLSMSEENEACWS
jgi:hypothetical protein